MRKPRTIAATKPALNAYEYGMILGLFAMLIFTAVSTTGAQLGDSFGSIATTVAQKETGHQGS